MFCRIVKLLAQIVNVLVGPSDKFSNLPTPLLSKPPCFVSNLHPYCFFLLPSFFCWMGNGAKFGVLFYLMRLPIYTCQALVP